MTATTKALLKLDNCLLHPAKKVANYATPRCLLLLPVSNGIAIMTTDPSLLFYAQTGSAITTSTYAIILLPFNQDNSAIMTATHASLLLPLFRTNQQLWWQHMPHTHFSWLLSPLRKLTSVDCWKSLSASRRRQLRNYGFKSLALLRQRCTSNYDGNTCQLLTSVECWVPFYKSQTSCFNHNL